MAGVKPNEANGFTKDLLGLKPRMIERVYQMKNELRKTHDIEISCYMLEIYLNKLEDVFWKLQTQQKYQGKEKSKVRQTHRTHDVRACHAARCGARCSPCCSRVVSDVFSGRSPPS
jgi:hypothetical protein